MCASAQSIPGLPSLTPKAATPAALAASEPTLADWTARLEAAREEHRVLAAQAADSVPLLGQRQMASARRLVLLSARVDALKSRSGADKPASAALAQPPTLKGEPPYGLLEVDALRDHLDVLSAQRNTLQQVLKSLDTAVESAIEARSEAQATLRLRREQAAAPGPAGRQDELRAQLDLAELMAEVAELEVIQGDELRRSARERLAALSEPIARIQAEIDRARSQLRFDEADLSLVLKRIETQRQRLTAESARLAERLLKGESLPLTDDGLRLRVVEPINQAIQMLGELEALERSQEMLWRARRGAIDGTIDTQRRSMAAARLGTSLAELRERRQRVSEEGRLVRSQLRTQQALVTGLAAADPARAGEQAVIQALQAQSDAQDRLRDGIDRIIVLGERTRVEMGGTDSPTSAMEWLEHAWTKARDGMTAVWQYELFSATETTQVEGRVVTVEHGVTVGKSIGVLVMLAVGFWAAKRLSDLLVRLIGRRVPLSAQLARVLRRWISSILLLVVVLIVLKMARIPLTAFAFLGGALAIGIGFGAQNVIKNLISGVIILFERKIRVGDVVSIGGTTGTVTTVDLRATTVRGFDGIDAIVPNSTLLENQISNWSGGSPDVRRTVAVGVAYGSDLRKAADAITECARAHSSVLAQPAPEVLFEDFGSDNLTLRLFYWTRLGGPRGGPGVDSDLRFAIAEALASAGIQMAFAQRDVHLDVPGTLRVEVSTGSPPDPHHDRTAE